MMKDFEERHRVRIFQAWGMTETSPVAAYSRPLEREHDESYWEERARQGRPLPWVELRLVDDAGSEVPWDGEATGEIEVRGPWIAARYFRDESGDEKFDAGWLRTGDIAAVDPQGSVQITDRAKDVIKSGGEWISSVELENAVMAHPDVFEAAVIAIPDARWSERPLVAVVPNPGRTPAPADLLEFLNSRVARWWLPESWTFIAEIPKTSVGKFDKKVMRAAYADGAYEVQSTPPPK
jgi:fatty-acyl-CoA synthase